MAILYNIIIEKAVHAVTQYPSSYLISKSSVSLLFSILIQSLALKWLRNIQRVRKTEGDGGELRRGHLTLVK